MLDSEFISALLASLGGGGIYLSRTTHQSGYYPLQQELERVLSQGKHGALSHDAPDDYARCGTVIRLNAKPYQSSARSERIVPSSGSIATSTFAPALLTASAVHTPASKSRSRTLV